MRRVALAAVAVTVLAWSATAVAARNPGLPNPVLTPGATNPAVTPATIHSTICVSGYSSSVRPPESYTESLKYRQLDSGYNLRGDTRAGDYEEDHLIPLEVGGNPTSVRNLWPEPWNVTWNAGRKDHLENVMHELVCSGQVGLRTAQRMFATNWIAGYERYVG
ncbi:MAG TPA: hypothetical protein VGS61_07110 [Acidimicrobiales bacterium]|nr:hypothetical protein [Acidimicrobiales bacterium]